MAGAPRLASEPKPTLNYSDKPCALSPAALATIQKDSMKPATLPSPADVVAKSAGRIFVLFDDGARDIDAAIVHLAVERGLNSRDAVVIIRRVDEEDAHLIMRVLSDRLKSHYCRFCALNELHPRWVEVWETRPGPAQPHHLRRSQRSLMLCRKTLRRNADQI